MVLVSRVDLMVIAVYMVLMVVVGVLLSYFNKSDSDFFKSGNKMPWWLSGFSFFMTSFSVWTFTGAAGLAYRAPAVGMLMYLSNALTMSWGVFFLAKLWRRSRSATIMSYLSERYGVSTNQVYSWTHLVLSLVQGGIQLLALGTFISVAMGTDLRLTIIVCGVVIAIYCLIGGLWAVVVTDTLQFMVLFPIALVVMFLGLHEMGGVSALWNKAPEGLWQIHTQEFSWSYLLAYAIVMSFAFNSGSAAQRYFSVKNEKEARKTALLSMILLLSTPAVFLLPPVASRLTGLDLSSITLGLSAPEEAAYVGFCLKYLPAGAIGIMLAAMLSATMSSLSATFNAYAGVLTEDIIRQIFWKKASSKTLLLIGRLTTLIFGGMVIGAAIWQSTSKGGVFGLMMTFSGIVIVPAGIPIVCGLFYRHTPRWAGIASFMTGLTIGSLCLYLNIKLTFTDQVFYLGGISAAIYFLPGLFLKPKEEYKSALDRLFAKLTAPVLPDEVGDTETTDLGSLRITGWTTVSMGLAVMALALLNLPLRGRLINLVIGILTAAIGAWLLGAAWIIVHRKRAALPKT
jgi:SSS family transporter